MKLCVDCKYVKPHRSLFMNYPLCGHPNNFDLSTGLPENSCYVLRKMSGWFNKSCGRKGRWWELKEEEK